MEQCPVCLARFKDHPICYRCGADLSVLLRIESESAALERHAVTLLHTGQTLEARRTAEHALALRCSPLASAVSGFARQEWIAEDTRWLEQWLQQ